MLNLFVEVGFLAGEELSDVLMDMKTLAQRLDCGVCGKFNGIVVSMTPARALKEEYDAYWQQVGCRTTGEDNGK